MKINGTRYSRAFKFQVVLEALKAEGKGTERVLSEWDLALKRLSGPGESGVRVILGEAKGFLPRSRAQAPSGLMH